MFLEAGLLTRRSVRQFVPGRIISRQDMADVLKIAMYAPSGCNRQPWEFVVVDDEKLKAQIAELHQHASFAKDASAVIFVCGDTEKECDRGFWPVDCSAATQNLLLALHGRGLGGCWCAIYPYEERMAAFQKLLGLPANVKPLCLVAAGYPAKMPPQPKDRYDENKVHYNGW